jgi:hypothetical protein
MGGFSAHDPIEPWRFGAPGRGNPFKCRSVPLASEAARRRFVHRWLLEYDNDNEVYTLPETDDAAIARVLGWFDGQRTFYCCLFDTTDESCLWCVGEPDRRLVEGRLVDGDLVNHFVVRSRRDGEDHAMSVRCDASAAGLITVAAFELLTQAEALSIFLAFHRGREIPSDFEAVAGARLFGANSYGI